MRPLSKTVGVVGCGMSDGSVRESIEEIAEETVTAEGFELVEARISLRSRRQRIALFIDRPDASVSLDDCARVSRAVEDVLDCRNLIEGRYVLEVSSPGLDRVLRGERDFIRFQGERARVTTRRPVEGQEFLQGILGEVREGRLSMKLDSGKDVLIPLKDISAARLEIVP